MEKFFKTLGSIALSSLLLVPGIAEADTITGSPSTVTGVASGSCTDNMAWTITAGDLAANDSAFVDITGTAWDAGNITDELRMSDLGLTFAGTVASIDGIQVEVLGWTPSGTPASSYHTVSLFTAPGSNRGDNKASGSFPTADPGSTYHTFGANNDDWFTTGSWTQAEVEDPGFGVALCFTSGEANATMSLDHVRVTVTYTLQAAAAPTVTTNTETNVGVSSATLNGEITATGGTNATVRGFAWGTDSTLATTIATTTESGDFGAATFSQNVSTLKAGTTYYFRAYATNPTGTGYGSIQDFTTGTDATPRRVFRLFEGFNFRLFSGRIILFQQ